MTIFLNNEPTTMQVDSCLFEAMVLAGMHEKKGVAVAVNDEVIQRNRWNEFHLNEADKITIIMATQGG